MRDALASGSRVNWTFSCLPVEVAVIEAVTLRLTGKAGDDFGNNILDESRHGAIGYGHDRPHNESSATTDRAWPLG
jgi:hypothetical protein